MLVAPHSSRTLIHDILCPLQARRYPGCSFTAVSNSKTQKVYIDQQASAAGLKNVSVITADMNTFQAEGFFDRVISVEMFEHMKNYQVGSHLLHAMLAISWARASPEIYQSCGLKECKHCAILCA
jgi:hypothetical protein